MNDPVKNVIRWSHFIFQYDHCNVKPFSTMYSYFFHFQPFFFHFQTCWTISSCFCYFQPFTPSPSHLKPFKASCSHSHSRPFLPFQTIPNHFYTFPEIPAISNYFLIFSAFSIISQPFHPFTVITNHVQIRPAISSHAKPCQAILAIKSPSSHLQPILAISCPSSHS